MTAASIAPPYAHLSFRVVVTHEPVVADVEEPELSSPQPQGYVPFALVKCQIDGAEPLTSRAARPFDALELMALGHLCGEVDLYTCSCGISGCAGLHEPVQLEVGAKTVTWTFPQEGYAAQLAPHLRDAAGAPLPVTFDKRQYLRALAALEYELRALARKHAGLVVAPSELRDLGSDTFLATWPRMKKSARLARLEHDTMARMTGGLNGATLSVHTEFGTFELTVDNLRNSACPGWSRDKRDLTRRVARWAGLVALLQERSAEPLKAMDWEDLRYYAEEFAERQGTPKPGGGLPEVCPTEFWVGVRLTR